jgi:transposase InsO family protein
MKKYNLKCPIRKPNPHKKMLQAIDESHVAPNLLERKLKELGARAVLLTDITYLKRKDGKFSYLSAIKDAFTTEILGYAVSESL